MKVRMTKREKQLLVAISNFITANGYQPSMRELAAELSVSLTRIKQLVDSCEKKKFMSRAEKVARSFRVLVKV